MARPHRNWDAPARDIFGPAAPEGLLAWQHAWNIGYAKAARLLGCHAHTIRMAVRQEKRAGKAVQAPGRKKYRAPAPEGAAAPQEAPVPSPAIFAPPVPDYNPDRLSDEIRAQFAGGVPDKPWHMYEEDPVVWCEEKHPFIESKVRGRIPFVPWDWQKSLMRNVMHGGIHIHKKSRQVAVTTAYAVGFAHAFLYQYRVHGKPFHGHIFANKEDKALGIAKKSRLAVWTADLTDEDRESLSGCDPTTNVKKMYHREEGADNHIFVHTTTNVDIRGDDVNAFLIDEGAFILNLEDVWQACAGATEPGDFGAVVSTPNWDSGFFAEMCSTTQEHGWFYLPIDWRANEERMGNDQGLTWMQAKVKEIGQAMFDVEHGLKDIAAGSAMLNMERLRKFARGVPFPGTRPLVGHRYVKGVDIGGGGDRDDTVFTVIDITYNPAVVVLCQALGEGKRAISTQDRKTAIEAFDQKWLGQMFIDCTGNRDFVNLVVSRNKVPVHFSAGMEDKLHLDKGERMRVRAISRRIMTTRMQGLLDTGTLVVHEKRHPELWEALATARYPKVEQHRDGTTSLQTAAKSKRLGKNPDHWDSVMLATRGLGRLKDAAAGTRTTKEQRAAGSRSEWAVGIAAEAKGYKELHVPGPADNLRDQKW